MPFKLYIKDKHFSETDYFVCSSNKTFTSLVTNCSLEHFSNDQSMTILFQHHLFDWLTNRLNEWLTDWVNDWLTNRLIEWLNDRVTDSLSNANLKMSYHWNQKKESLQPILWLSISTNNACRIFRGNGNPFFLRWSWWISSKTPFLWQNFG